MKFWLPSLRNTRPADVWFAWHPVILEDGRVAWLEHVSRGWAVKDLPNCEDPGDLRAYNEDGCWVYNAIRR